MNGSSEMPTDETYVRDSASQESVNNEPEPDSQGEGTLIGGKSGFEVGGMVSSDTSGKNPTSGNILGDLLQGIANQRQGPDSAADPVTINPPGGKSISPPGSIPPWISNPASAFEEADQTLNKPAGSKSDPPEEPLPTLVPGMIPVSSQQSGPSTAKPQGPVTNPMVGPPTSPMDGPMTPAVAGYDTLVKPSGVSAPSAANTRASGAEPVVNTTILSGYEVLGVLGRGGMGVVYKARQVGLNRVVALKMILTGSHASELELVRFKTEAQAVARLTHPNIIQIFDIGERDGRPYFSLEFCEGGSLQQKLDGTPMDPRRAAGLMELIARAIQYAHEKNIIHRDLKPANILLTGDGSPKITDFGLAKLMESDQGQTGTEAILGTPTYMAPEQAQGKTRDVGPNADIYSLGAIFYDLLTGRPPFRGTTALDTLQMVQSAEPIPPGRLNTRVPADLQTICLKCLEKEPARRYRSAGELADELRRFLDGKPIISRPASVAERVWKWALRHPTKAGLVALAVLAPLVITIVSVGFTIKLAVANEEIARKNSQLHDEKVTVQKQKNDLDEANQVLVKQRNDLATKEKQLRENYATLQQTFLELDKSEKASQQNFLAAQEAAEQLLKVARQELRLPGTESIRRTLLTQAADMCRRFAVIRPGDKPIALYRSARAARMVGDLEATLGNSKASIENHKKALKGFQTLLAGVESGKENALPDADYEAELLESQVQLWAVLERTGSPEADEVLFSALERISHLSPEKRKSSEYRRLEGVLLGDRGLHYQRRGQIQLALSDYNRAIELLTSEKHLTNVELEVARFLTNRAAVRMDGMGWWLGDPATRYAQSCKDAEQSVEILRGLLNKRDDMGIAIELGRAYNVQATGYVLLNQPQKALQTYEIAVKQFQVLRDRAQLAVDPQHLLALARGSLGSFLLLNGKYKEGLENLRESREILAQLAKNYPHVVTYKLDLGRQWLSEGAGRVKSGEMTQAIAAFERARALFAEVLKANPSDLETRRALLTTLGNLIFCRDFLAREAIRSRAWFSGRDNIQQLIRLRAELERHLEPLRDIPGVWPWLVGLGQRIMLRLDRIETILSYSQILERLKDHRTTVTALENLRPLLSSDWPGWVEVAARVSRCITLMQGATTDPIRKKELGQSYAKIALGMLRGALESHRSELIERLKEVDFAALREIDPQSFAQLETPANSR